MLPASAWLARFYLLGLAVWLGLKLSFGDGFWWLYILNVGTDYLVASLPVALFFALRWQRARWIVTGASLVFAVVFVGNLHVPASSARADGPSLKIMSFNVSADVRSADPMVSAIRRADPDVACIQELDKKKAAAVASELQGEYPFQLLRTERDDYAGMGIISRYPLRESQRAPTERAWIGPPLVGELDWNGTSITVVNAHAIHAFMHHPALIEGLNTLRLREARSIADFVQAEQQPAVLCADFNATPHSSAYGALTSALVDSWREAGVGPGFSWDLLPVELGVFRIDYVMHSRQLRAVEAHVERWDRASDHRPVSARLTLVR